MAVLEALLLAAGLALAVRLLLAYAKFRRLELAIPGPYSLPLLGSLHRFIGVTPDTILSVLLKLSSEHRPGEMWRVSGFGQLVVFVSDPDHLQELYSRREFADKDTFAYKFYLLLGNGIVNLNGEEWRAHRRAFQPAFHQRVLDGYTPVFSCEALGFVRRVRPGEAQDVEDNLREMVARMFLVTAIASDEGEDVVVQELLPPFKAMLVLLSQTFIHRMVQPWLWIDWAFLRLTKTGRRIRQLTAEVDALCRKVFSARRCLLQRGRVDFSVDDSVAPSAKRRPLVDVLLEPGDRLSLSDQELLDEFKTFMGATIDTTVSTLTWALKTLSLRQDVQERIVQEAEEVLGKDRTSPITTEEIDRLEYTERVIKETLRLLPTGPFIARAVKWETGLGGHTLPAGAIVAVNILAAHRDPRHWPDPLRFDPDRFLPESSVGRHPYAYLPFSAGPRNCIGGRYAMMLMKTLLATLVPRYRIDPVDDGYKEPADFPMSTGVASWMVGGAKVKFTATGRGLGMGCAA